MDNMNNHPTDKNEDSGDDQDIRRLLEAAGPRRQPSDEMRARVHAAVLDEWQTTVTKTNQERWNWRQMPKTRTLLTLAAAVIVSVATLLTWQGTQRQGPVLANVQYASGAYAISGTDVAAEERSLGQGAIVSTHVDSRLMLSLAAGSKIRLDQSSQILIHDADTVELMAGRIYIDSALQDQLRILTPTATVTDIGTLFEVSLQPSGLAVALREGQINITTPAQTIDVSANTNHGELIELASGTVSRTPLSTTDEHWRWTQQARPPMQLLDVSVYEYLMWVARDTGRTLKFVSRSAELQAQSEHFKSAISSDQVNVDLALEATARFQRVASEPHILLVGLIN